jgi:long-chain acyl-CoA synthetase
VDVQVHVAQEPNEASPPPVPLAGKGVWPSSWHGGSRRCPADTSSRPRDLALVHADGSLRVLGRLDDTLVLTNGENVNAPYLENELCASEWIDRAVVVGAGRPYVAAFVAPSRTHLERLARSLGLDASEPAALVSDERIVKHYRSLVNAISGDARRFAPYERVHRMRLWLEDFRIGHELSQTLKLRRQEFLRLYSCEIDELYTR